MAIRLQAARVNAELTQAEACAKLRERGFKTAVSTLVSWEAGKTAPTLPTFRALCDIYGCSMDDIDVWPKC